MSTQRTIARNVVTNQAGESITIVIRANTPVEEHDHEETYEVFIDGGMLSTGAEVFCCSDLGQATCALERETFAYLSEDL